MLPANNQSSTIPVYQALQQPGKITNQSSRPDLVYSRLTTFDLLLKQVKKEGIGIIFSSCFSTVENAKRTLGCKEVQVVDQQNLNEVLKLVSAGTKILVISLKPGTTIRVSDLEVIARSVGHNLKWISILHQPYASQLFKWELKYNCN
jgi:hypothetical protein